MANNTLMGAVQEALRGFTGTAQSYQGDWHAYLTQNGIPNGSWSERVLGYAKTLDASITTASAAENYFLLNPGNILNIQKLLWPTGTEPGLWISPRSTSVSYQDSGGTTALSAIGSVLDSSNPVGLILDKRKGLVLGPELVITPYAGTVTGGWGFSGNTITRDGVTAGGVATLTITSHTASARCKITFDVADLSGDTFSMLSGTGSVGEITTNGSKSYYFDTLDTVSMRFIAWGGGAGTVTISNISVKEIPGNHATQATSAARPLASGRVNLLTKTEDFSDAIWSKLKGGAGTVPVITQNFATSPDGTNTAARMECSTGGSTSGDWALLRQIFSGIAAGSTGLNSIYAKSNSGATQKVFLEWNGTRVLIDITTEWTRISKQGYTGTPSFDILTTGDGGTSSVIDILIWHPQAEFGTSASPYQRVNTDSDYTLSSLIYDKFDGVDDGWASGTVAAGVIGNSNMDCLIAVRRDTTANVIIAYQTEGAGWWFGCVESGAGTSCVSNAGTPTVWVDGVQLSGGTAVTRGTLHTALTVGVWHILEFRGLDLSTWTQFQSGHFTAGYNLVGAFGGDGIELFPSNPTNRDKARTALAATVGLVM